MKTKVLQVRVEPALTQVIDSAVKRTGLTRSELLRQGLRKGVPEVVRSLERGPQQTLVDALFDFKGVEIPERRHPMKRRV